jgi:hypothetical protein
MRRRRRAHVGSPQRSGRTGMTGTLALGRSRSPALRPQRQPWWGAIARNGATARQSCLCPAYIHLIVTPVCRTSEYVTGTTPASHPASIMGS